VLAPLLPPALGGGGGGGGALAAAAPAGPPAGAPGAACWLDQVYGYALDVEDVAPGLGPFWYLLQESTAAARPAFAALIHLHAAAFALPLALRLPRRPLLLLWAQLVASGVVFRPHGSAGDAALPAALAALLLARQLSALPFKMLYANLLVALAALAPAVWAAWAERDAANANCFFAVGLAWAGGHVALLSHALSTAVEEPEAG